MEMVKNILLVVLTLLYIDALMAEKPPDCPLPMEQEPRKCQELGLNYYLTEPVAGNIIVNCVL